MKWLRWGLLVTGLGLLLFGAFSGGFRFIWSRAASLCLSCMGLQ